MLLLLEDLHLVRVLRMLRVSRVQLLLNDVTGRRRGSVSHRDGAVRVSGEDSTEGVDFFLEVVDGALKLVVVSGEEFDLGLKRLKPLLLALTTLESGCV
jgi:hypothetical protein